MVILSLNNAVFLLHLCDIEIGYLQLMVFPHIIPNLVVSRLAFCSSHIQFIHADVHFDMPLDMEFGQKENRFAMPRPREKVHRLHLFCPIPMLFQGQ